VRAVFEREWMVRTDELITEIVRLAPGQVTNAEIENGLNNQEEFVRRKIDGYEMITTRAIIAEEQAIIDGVKAGMGSREALVSEADYRKPDELAVSYDALERICDDARCKKRGDDRRARHAVAPAARGCQPLRDD
jgi:hypothetical protein